MSVPRASRPSMFSANLNSGLPDTIERMQKPEVRLGPVTAMGSDPNSATFQASPLHAAQPLSCGPTHVYPVLTDPTPVLAPRGSRARGPSESFPCAFISLDVPVLRYMLITKCW